MSGNALIELMSATSLGAGWGRGARPEEVFGRRDNLLLAAGVELLREARDQPETRQLIAQLIRRGLLGAIYRRLAESDPAAAGQLIHVSSRVLGSVERLFKRPQETPAVELSGEEAGLLADWLRVLAGVAATALERGGARTRARMALAWGKMAPIERMGRQWLEDSDARVRANAVESLWGRDDAEAVEIFRQKLADPHQRVAANAAVGLYLAGDSEAVQALRRMAEEGDPARKAAAVWAMGRTGDARFLPLLAGMRRMHPAPVQVLRNVVIARERIRHAEGAPRQLVEVEAAVVAAAAGLTVDVRVQLDNAEPVRGFRPVDFCLEADDTVVWDYRVRPKPPLGGTAVWLVAPADSNEEVERLAKAVVRDAGDGGARVVGITGYSVRSGAAERRVGEVLAIGEPAAVNRSKTAKSLDSWREMIERCAERLSAESGERHVVVLVGRNSPAWMAEALRQVAEQCGSAGVKLDILLESGTLPAPAMEAARTCGRTVRTVQGGDYEEAFRRLVEGWSDGWRLEAAGVQAGRLPKLRVIVRTGRYFGEAVLERTVE